MLFYLSLNHISNKENCKTASKTKIVQNKYHNASKQQTSTKWKGHQWSWSFHWTNVLQERQEAETAVIWPEVTSATLEKTYCAPDIIPSTETGQSLQIPHSWSLISQQWTHTSSSSLTLEVYNMRDGGN